MTGYQTKTGFTPDSMEQQFLAGGSEPIVGAALVGLVLHKHLNPVSKAEHSMLQLNKQNYNEHNMAYWTLSWTQ